MKCPKCGSELEGVNVSYETAVRALWDLDAGDWHCGTAEERLDVQPTYLRANCPDCGALIVRGHRAVRKLITGQKATTTEGISHGRAKG